VVTVDELKTFMSLCIMMSVVKNDTLQAYWCTQKSTETPFLPSVMSFERYKLQCKYRTFFLDSGALDGSDCLQK